MTVIPDSAVQAVDWDCQHAMTNDEIDRQNAADPDAVPLTKGEGIALRV